MGNEIKIKKIDPSQIRYTPQVGEIIQNPEGEYLIWKDDQWNKINMESSGIDLSLYDMNKQIIAQLPDLIDWDRVEALLNDFYNLHHNTYYMMYGKEISYFTLFKVNEPLMFGDTVADCIPNVGTVKAVDMTEANDAVEIWVINNNEPTCLYLFPYDMGLVEVGE